MAEDEQIRQNRKEKVVSWLYLANWGMFFLPVLFLRISSVVSYGILLINMGLFLALFVHHIKKGIYLDVFSIWFLAVVVLDIFMTILLKTPGKIPATIRITIFPLIQAMFLIQWSGKASGYEGFKRLYQVCVAYIALNFIVMIIFPAGLINSDSGSSVVRAEWIYGSKNNIAPYITVMITVIVAYSWFNKIKSIWTYIFIFMAGYAICMAGEDGLQLLGGSSTAIMMFALLLGLMGYYSLTVKYKLPQIPAWLLYLGMAFIYCFIFYGGTVSWLSDFIVNVLHKNPSYSGRTAVWDTMFGYISKSPLFGFGEREDLLGTVYILGVETHTTYTYNMVVRVLLNYGYTGLFAIVAYVLAIKDNKNICFKILLSGYICILFLGTMNEIGYGYWMFLPLFLAAFVERGQYKWLSKVPAFTISFKASKLKICRSETTEALY